MRIAQRESQAKAQDDDRAAGEEGQRLGRTRSPTMARELAAATECRSDVLGAWSFLRLKFPPLELHGF